MEEQYIEVSIKVCFATAYHVMDCFALNTNPNKDDALLKQIKSEMYFLLSEYNNAVNEDREQTAAFINFKKDYSYLHLYFEKVKTDVGLKRACNNFAKALVFEETCQQFGLGNSDHHFFTTPVAKPALPDSRLESNVTPLV